MLFIHYVDPQRCPADAGYAFRIGASSHDSRRTCRQAQPTPPHRVACEAKMLGRGRFRTGNRHPQNLQDEGESHDVVENKRSASECLGESHDVIENKQLIVYTHDLHDNKGGYENRPASPSQTVPAELLLSLAPL
jgi:hypothetical protein